MKLYSFACVADLFTSMCLSDHFIICIFNSVWGQSRESILMRWDSIRESRSLDSGIVEIRIFYALLLKRWYIIGKNGINGQKSRHPVSSWDALDVLVC